MVSVGAELSIVVGEGAVVGDKMVMVGQGKRL